MSINRLKLVFAAIILFSCSSEDTDENYNQTSEPVSEREESEGEESGNNGNSSDQIIFNIPGIDGFDYGAHKIMSPFEVESIGGDETFKAPDYFQNNPIYIVNKNEEVIFGYYPEIIENQEITIEDILLFFIAGYPEIHLYSKPIIEIREKLALLDNTDLNLMIKESLKQNASPLEDNIFLESLKRKVDPIISNLEISRGSESDKQSTEEYFEVKFKRYGVFLIPNQAPMYASLGIGFYDVEENIVEYKLLNSKSISLTPSSYANYLYDKFMNPDPNLLLSGGITEHAWTGHDGEMEVQVSNGRQGIPSMITLSSITAEHNSKMMSAILMGYVVPEVLFSENTASCLSTIEEKIQNRSSILSEILVSAVKNQTLSTSLIYDQLESLSKYLSEIILENDCYDVFMKTYLATSISHYSKMYLLPLITFLETSEVLAQFTFLSIDFSNSIIHEKQTLIFDEEKTLLFSPEIEVTEPDSYTSKENPGTEVLFNFKFQEILKKYKIERNIQNVKLIPEDFKSSGEELFFKVSKITGDARLLNDWDNSQIYETGLNGDLDIIVETGESNSEFEITPNFEYFDFKENIKIEVEEEEVDLKSLLLQNYWSLINPYGGNFSGTITETSNDGSTTTREYNNCCGGIGMLDFIDDGSIILNSNSQYYYTANNYSLNGNQLDFKISIDDQAGVTQNFEFSGEFEFSSYRFVGEYQRNLNDTQNRIYISGGGKAHIIIKD